MARARRGRCLGRRKGSLGGSRLRYGKRRCDRTQAGDFQAASSDAFRTVDTQAVLDNIDLGYFLVVVSRSPERFRGDANALEPVAGHIPHARNRFYQTNLDANGHFKSAEELRREFEAAIGNYPSTDVVLQCGSGVTACHNALAMEIAGLGGARLYPGSWSEWIGDPSRPVARSVPEAAG